MSAVRTRGSQNTYLGYSAGQTIDGSTTPAGDNNLMLGAYTGWNWEGSNRLEINAAGSGGGTPLISGDFSSRTLNFDATGNTVFNGSVAR
ncbi:hypothetical protein [Pedobacter sp. NJ-S-72]